MLKFWSRVETSDYVDETPGGVAFEADGGWGNPSICNDVSLTPAEKATLETSGTLALNRRYLLVLNQIDPTDEEVELLKSNTAA